MFVEITRIGKRTTKKCFDLETERNEFKAYMKNQKQFQKSFQNHNTFFIIVIHASCFTKEFRIYKRCKTGKPTPIGSVAVPSIDAEILLGY